MSYFKVMYISKKGVKRGIACFFLESAAFRFMRLQRAYKRFYIEGVN